MTKVVTEDIIFNSPVTFVIPVRAFAIDAVYSTPSVASGSFNSQTLTLPEAELGDIASCSITSVLPPGTFLIAKVTAVKTVVIEFFNLSGSAQQINLTRLRVTLMKTS